MNQKLRKIPVSYHIPRCAGTFINFKVMHPSLVQQHEKYRWALRKQKKRVPHKQFYRIDLNLDNSLDFPGEITFFIAFDNENLDLPGEESSVRIEDFKKYLKQDLIRIRGIVINPVSNGILPHFSLIEEICNIVSCEPCYFTILRKPFGWHQSMFYYLRDVGVWEPTHGKFKGMSFSDYINSEFLPDSWLIRNLIGLRDDHAIISKEYDETIQLLYKFKIGFFENLPKFLKELKEEFGFSVHDIETENDLTNKNKISRKEDISELSENDLKVFNERVKYDIMLYDYFKEYKKPALIQSTRDPEKDSVFSEIPLLYDFSPQDVESNKIFWRDCYKELQNLPFPTLKTLSDAYFVIHGPSFRAARASTWNDTYVAEKGWWIPPKLPLPLISKNLQGNYVTFHNYFSGNFGHFLHDQLPIIAWLITKVSPMTKFLLLDHPLHREVLSTLDPKFLKERVEWIQLDDAVHIEGNLTFIIPGQNYFHDTPWGWVLKGTKLSKHLRRWVSVAPIEITSKRTIIYYKRRGSTPRRIFNEVQEKKIVETIRRAMQRHGRKEQFVIFDGKENGKKMSQKNQAKLFRSAQVAIGPHGSGLANVMWMQPSPNSNNLRPQVLEFVTSPRSPKVQKGSKNGTYWFLFGSMPWLDYYHIRYKKESSEEPGKATYIDLPALEMALDAMWAKPKNINNKIEKSTENLPIVVCYFEEVNKLEDSKENEKENQKSRELIQMWKKTWSRNGWRPIVLGPRDAEKHPDFRSVNLKDHTSNLFKYSLHNSIYQQACYRRWFAYADYATNIKQNIMWADFDVINYSFTPDMLPSLRSSDDLIPFNQSSACGYSGTKGLNNITAGIKKVYHDNEFARSLAQKMANKSRKEGRKLASLGQNEPPATDLYSDMYILRHTAFIDEDCTRAIVDGEKLLTDAGVDDVDEWKLSPLVHFSYSILGIISKSVQKAVGKNRAQIIKILRDPESNGIDSGNMRYKNSLQTSNLYVKSDNKQHSHSNLKKDIYTYYDDLPTFDDDRKKLHLNMIKIWKDNWQKAGWNPVVLSRKDAESHPFYQEYIASIKEKLMSKKGQTKTEYELACFTRWLAVANRGGGFMCDYDVLNKGGFRPLHEMPNKLTAYQHFVPCLVSGSAESFLYACRIFANCDSDKAGTWYQEDKNANKVKKFNFSDMFVIMNIFTDDDIIKKRMIVVFESYRKKRKQEKKDIQLVHFNSDSFNGNRKLRLKRMKEFNNSIKLKGKLSSYIHKIKRIIKLK